MLVLTYHYAFTVSCIVLSFNLMKFQHSSGFLSVCLSSPNLNSTFCCCCFLRLLVAYNGRGSSNFMKFQCSSSFLSLFLSSLCLNLAFFKIVFLSCWWPVMTGVLTKYSRENHIPYHFRTKCLWLIMTGLVADTAFWTLFLIQLLDFLLTLTCVFSGFW